MDNALVVAAPPSKPVLIFDGDCDFCALCVRRLRKTTGDSVEYLPFQNARVAAQFPELPRERCETSVQLVEADGAVYSAAAAVLRAVAHNPSHRRLWRWYEQWPAFADLAECGYRFVAAHRSLFSRLTR